jgi:AcrR family transcriptional regulator
MARPNKNNQKKAQIIATAEKVFTKLGYAKTTLDDVANAAQLNKATLYHYFKNKEAIFFTVIAGLMQKAFTKLQQTINNQKTPEKKLVQFFNLRVTLYLAQLKLNALSKEALLVLQPQFDALYAPYKQQEIKEIAQVCRQINGTQSIAKTTTLVTHLFTLLDALKHDAIFLSDLLDGDTKAIIAINKKVQLTLQIFIQTLKK